MAAALLVIDWRVADAEGLLANADSAFDIVYLARDRDGIAQIAEAVRGKSDLAALHVLSHGSEAALWLGNSILEPSTLSSRAADLRRIGNALREGGDILLYGCNVAAGEAGRRFMASLAELTGADVCASRNLTGSARLGGDWLLEEAVGAIEARAPFDSRAMAEYRHVLSHDERGQSAVLRADGKLLVAGYSHGDSTSNDFALWLYNGDGTLDTSFGSGGRVTTDIAGSSFDVGSSVILQSNGKIVVAGGIGGGATNSEFALVRYDASGSLDTTFGGGDGIVTTNVSAARDGALSVVLQADGRIVVGGNADAGFPFTSFALARYSADGSLDTAFDGDGMVITQIGGTGEDFIEAIALQSDGKILAAGGSGVGGLGTPYDFALARYNSDGTLDTSFGGGDGIVTTAFGSSHDVGRALALHGGKIVVAGTSWNGSIFEFALARYNADGALDTSFGGDGRVTTPIGTVGDPGPSSHALAVQSDGKIVLAGAVLNNGGIDFGLVRYNTDGTLDATFDGDGILLVRLSAGEDRPMDLVLRPDGTMVVVGQSQIGSGFETSLVIVAADGSVLGVTKPDPTDPTGPIVSTEGRAQCVALRPDGKLLVAGYSHGGSTDNDFALWRYNDNGKLDTSFGNGGKVTTDIAGSSFDVGSGIILQSDDKIVVAGSIGGGTTNSEFALVRYNASGSLDTTFGGGDGIVRTNVSPARDGALSVAVQSDGKLVVGGNADVGYPNTSFALVRHTESGDLDTLFGGGDGMVITQIGDTGEDFIEAIALQSDGKILAAGASGAGTLGSPYDFALARYTESGDLDTTFGGGDGVVTTAFGASHDTGRALALHGGKIVVAGTSWNGSIFEFAVARYNADGTLDAGFSGDGKVTTPIGTLGDPGPSSYAVAVQTDGKIVVAGPAMNNGNIDFGLVRYNTDGTLDATFDGDGILLVRLSAGEDRPMDLLLRPDGTMVAVGTKFTSAGVEVGLVIVGTNGDDVLIGGAGDDTIFGFAGNDTLDGKLGSDRMLGGIGNDTFFVDDAGDQTIENGGEGTDTANTAISLTLAANVENLTLLGTANLSGTGNAQNNVLTGNSGANVLAGAAGSDTIVGFAGADTVDGGTSTDTLVLGASSAELNAAADNRLVSVEAVDASAAAAGVVLNLSAQSDGFTVNLSAQSDNVAGSAGADTISAGAGLDTIMGFAGADAVDGGADADTLVLGTTSADLNGAADHRLVGVEVVDASAAATGVVLSLAAQSDGFTVNLSAQGDNVAGSAGADTISAGAGLDTIVGFAGADTVDGGTSTDTLQLLASSAELNAAADNRLVGVEVVDASAAATGVVLSLAAQSDGFTVNLSAQGDNVTGSAGADTISAGAGLDTIVGFAGADTLDGGADADTLVLGTTSADLNGVADHRLVSVEVVDASAAAAGVTVNLSAQSEGFTVNGSAAVDSITGGAGGDTLEGGAGADTLIGGAGNDIYVIDAADQLLETPGEGRDRAAVILAAFDLRALTSIEDLEFRGQGAFTGHGDAADNAIRGGNAADLLEGDLGNDELEGGGGDDMLRGDGGDDTLRAGSGNNVLVGGAGRDVAVLLGRIQDYQISVVAADQGPTFFTLAGLDPGDVVNLVTRDGRIDRLAGVEQVVFLGANASDPGDDAVFSVNREQLLREVPVALDPRYVADLAGTGFLQGGALDDVLDGLDGDDQLLGGAGRDTLLGEAGNDTLEGGAGDDALSGGTGNDVLKGGLGNDVYVIDSLQDVIVENAGEGTRDRVRSLLEQYSIASLPEIEILEFGADGNFTGTGNTRANTLVGGAGNDTLDGGLGADRMEGGAGNDTYFVDLLANAVTLAAGDTVVELIDGGTADTVRSSVSYILGANLENLVLTGTANRNGTGNGGANTLTGNDGNNVLSGGAGNDTFFASSGNDRFVGGAGTDTLNLSPLMFAQKELPGGFTVARPNTTTVVITSGTQTFTVTGAWGAVSAEKGIESYVFSDQTVTLAQLIEDTASAFADTFTAIAGANTMSGGLGNDTYTVDHAGDQVVELAGQGTDLVWTALDAHTLAANVEQLRYTGSGNFAGNGNAGANKLTGGAGNDTLDGGLGADRMEGGAGNDTYIVSVVASADGLIPGDVAFEGTALLDSGGTDTVRSVVSYTLGVNVENLVLIAGPTGVHANINGTGNALGNSLSGNDGKNVLSGGGGNDTLNGGLGIDTLRGGAGNDIFVFDNLTSTDRIADFAAGDQIGLDDAIFSALEWAGGELAAGQFQSVTSTTAASAGMNLVYNSVTGQLFYDADGTGTGADATIVAILGTHPALAVADFMQL